jgi:hypothetical protein
MKKPNPSVRAGAGGGDDRQSVAPDIARPAPSDNRQLARALDELPGANGLDRLIEPVAAECPP